MGRSKPTFRNYLDRLEGDWAPYRRTLRRRDQPHFDRLFERAREHADAAGQLDPADPRLAILFSMLLSHERELLALREQLDEGHASRPGDGGEPRESGALAASRSWFETAQPSRHHERRDASFERLHSREPGDDGEE